MASQMQAVLETSLTQLNNIVKKPEKFLETDSKIFGKVTVLAKVLYDLTKLSEDKDDHKTLKELIVEDFDEEQVWAQVEMQNKSKLQDFQTQFSSLNQKLATADSNSLLLGEPPTKKRKLEEIEEHLDHFEDEHYSGDDQIDMDDNVDDDGNSDNSGDENEKMSNIDEEEDILNDPDFQHMSDSEGDDLPLFEDLDEEEKDSGDEEGTYRAKEKRDSRKTEVDDKFFKISEMEDFLNNEDQREERKRKKAEELPNDEDDSEEEMDLFDNMSDNDDPEKRVMYADYFNEGKPKEDCDQPNQDDIDDDDEDEGVDGDNFEDEEKVGESVVAEKNDLFAADDDNDEDDDDEPKSGHQQREERLAKKIQKMEAAALGDKPWQMVGEVAAPARPENSLLAEHLDYDSLAKNAPAMTEEVCKKLEDIILQRVKDKAWDDVERKVKPVEDPLEYKKKLVLDQEKSKMSLAEVYEQEYLELAGKKEKVEVGSVLDKEKEETSKEVDKIKADMRSLFAKLDSLSHLHYTPKQKSAEVKIVRNIPSLAVEEVAPVAASNATLLAPAEVVDKEKGEAMGTEEREATDRKRERREKKAKKRAARIEREKREKMIEKINPGMGNKYSKEKARREIEEAEKQGKLSTIKDNGKKTVKSSSAFFTQLQEEVQSHVKEKTKKSKKKEDKNKSIASLKL